MIRVAVAPAALVAVELLLAVAKKKGQKVFCP